jgi:hypothetical protein
MHAIDYRKSFPNFGNLILILKHISHYMEGQINVKEQSAKKHGLFLHEVEKRQRDVLKKRK